MGLEINSTLLSILLATTIAGVFSITAAAIFSFALLSKMVERLVSLSVGIMLSTSLLHALPEAFESSAEPHKLFAVLLGGGGFAVGRYFLTERIANLESRIARRDDEITELRARQQAPEQGGTLVPLLEMTEVLPLEPLNFNRLLIQRKESLPVGEHAAPNRRRSFRP